MSHQLSECPNCRRTYITGTAAPGRGRCRICGTPLLTNGTEKEVEVRERLYGDRHSLRTVTRVLAREKGEG